MESAPRNAPATAPPSSSRWRLLFLLYRLSLQGRFSTRLFIVCSLQVRFRRVYLCPLFRERKRSKIIRDKSHFEAL